MESSETKRSSKSGAKGSMSAEVMAVLTKKPKLPVPRGRALESIALYDFPCEEGNICHLELEIADLVAGWSEIHRAIVGGAIAGMGRLETARYLGISVRTVQRVLVRLRRALS